jgi:hypothetical protein
MVNTLLVSMRMLSDVLVLIIFFLCVFSLLGMQLFMGELRNKCAVTIPDNINVSYSNYVTNAGKPYFYLPYFIFILTKSLTLTLFILDSCITSKLIRSFKAFPDLSKTGIPRENLWCLVESDWKHSSHL